MARSWLPLDDINSLKVRLREQYSTEGGEIDKSKRKEIEDEILDLLILSYVFGTYAANEQLGTDKNPIAEGIESSVFMPIDGKVWMERVDEYINGGTWAEIDRVIDTEAHRDYVTGQYDTAVVGGATQKTWMCQMLPTSRDTHMYLDGTTVPIDAEFYTYNGNKALFPGQFGVAEEDVNCMCEITYSK